MDPAKRAEILRKHMGDPADLSPDVRAMMDEAREYVEGKIARGEVLDSWREGDDFAIGLDANFEPYPVHTRDSDTTE